MIEFARISQMRDYQINNTWPFRGFPLSKGARFIAKIKDIIRIALDKGPIKSPYMQKSNSSPLEVFRGGTRGWEYPWVYKNVKQLATKKSRILDCGCGKSRFPIKMFEDGFQSYGLDFMEGNSYTKAGYGLSKRYINRHSKKIQFIIGGIQDIPIADGYFDIVTCISVMEHIVIDNKENPEFHLKCLKEMTRVLKPGGYLICTYDTILNKEILFSNKYGWGDEGWYYKEDIEYLLTHEMELYTSNHIPSRDEINNDPDTYFIPPDLFFAYNYGAGFCNDSQYQRLTSVGFVLRKKQ